MYKMFFFFTPNSTKYITYQLFLLFFCCRIKCIEKIVILHLHVSKYNNIYCLSCAFFNTIFYSELEIKDYELCL